MSKQELDTVRQVLEAALQNLRKSTGEEGSSESIALFADRLPSSENRGSEVPIVVVVAGNLSANSQGATLPQPTGLGDIKMQVNSSVSDYPERKVSHPGLERFTIEADSHPSAPKACFMEPGRICVNSGACEMRGF